MRTLASGDPGAFAARLAATNPTFRNFVIENQGKTPEQAFRDNGFDLDAVRSLM